MRSCRLSEQARAPWPACGRCWPKEVRITPPPRVWLAVCQSPLAVFCAYGLELAICWPGEWSPFTALWGTPAVYQTFIPQEGKVPAQISPLRNVNLTHEMWKVTPLHIKYKEWILSTSNVKSVFSMKVTPNVVSDSSQHKMWKVTFLHIKCEEWFLSTTYFKSNSFPHEMWRINPLNFL
jgi:hypothetical protein